MKKIFCLAWTLGVLVLMQTKTWAFPAYYEISETAQAQAEARDRNLPLAWVGSFPECLTVGVPAPGSQADLTQLAMAALKDNAVIIFFDGRNMTPVPPFIHAQYHIQDDGPLSDGANWVSPKIVFCNPEMDKILGRVSATQLKSDREAVINSALQVIRNDPSSLAPPAAVADSTSTPASSPASSTNAVSAGIDLMDWLANYGFYVAAAVLFILVAVTAWIMQSRR